MDDRTSFNIKSGYRLHIYAKIEQISNWYKMDIDIDELRAMRKFFQKFSVGIVQRSFLKTDMSRKWVINNISI